MSEQIIKTIMALPNGLTIKAFDGDEFEWNGVLDCTSGDLKDLTAELEAAKAEIERLREERRQIARHHNEMCTCLAIL
jgi:hypothetical protein